MKSSNQHNLAAFLYDTFNTVGIHGKNDMPEDILPKGMKRGSLEHLLFITFTVSIDYQREANEVWRRSRLTFEDPDTNYLYNPELLSKINENKVITDLQKYKLSKKPIKDANIWISVGSSFFRKWNSNPINLLKHCSWDANNVLEHLSNDYNIQNATLKSDFPYLGGKKIGPLWIRMLRDNVGITELRNLELIPIPVDIHIARASLALGVFRGKFSGKLNVLFNEIRKAWFQLVENNLIKNRKMIALDIDEPLWHLSKYGCSKHRDKITGSCSLYISCAAKMYCVKGMININKSLIELDT